MFRLAKHALCIAFGLSIGVLSSSSAQAGPSQPTEAYKNVTIKLIRAHTSQHWNTNAQNKLYVGTVETIPSPCAGGLWIDDANNANSATLSVLESALLAGKVVTVYYDVDTSTRSPWGDSTICLLTSATINR